MDERKRVAEQRNALARVIPSIIRRTQSTDVMRVNSDHSDFKYEGETNHAYESGRLQAYLEELARRVESDVEMHDAEDYVEKLKDKGILED